MASRPWLLIWPWVPWSDIHSKVFCLEVLRLLILSSPEQERHFQPQPCREKKILCVIHSLICQGRTQAYGLTETNSVAVSVSLKSRSYLINQVWLHYEDCGWRLYRTAHQHVSSWMISPSRFVSWFFISGRACPVNDIRIVHENTSVPPGCVGEVWLWVISPFCFLVQFHISAVDRRGPNVMKCYWRDPGIFIFIFYCNIVHLTRHYRHHP